MRGHQFKLNPLFRKIAARSQTNPTISKIPENLSPVGSPQLKAQEDLPLADKDTPSAMMARAFVLIFLHCMNRSGAKCALVYKELLSIMRTDGMDTETYLVVCRLLFRIRVDQNYRILLLHPTDMEWFGSYYSKIPTTIGDE